VFLRSEDPGGGPNGGGADDRGAAVPVAAVWALSRVWYQGRLDPGFTPRTRQDSQRILAEHGLTGEFWALG
jgi:hypothetical protein